MRNNARFVVAGAALGAVAGAIGGLMWVRYGSPDTKPTKALDARQVILLGGGILGVLRQIVEMS